MYSHQQRLTDHRERVSNASPFVDSWNPHVTLRFTKAKWSWNKMYEERQRAYTRKVLSDQIREIQSPLMGYINAPRFNLAKAGSGQKLTPQFRQNQQEISLENKRMSKRIDSVRSSYSRESMELSWQKQLSYPSRKPFSIDGSPTKSTSSRPSTTPFGMKRSDRLGGSPSKLSALTASNDDFGDRPYTAPAAGTLYSDDLGTTSKPPTLTATPSAVKEGPGTSLSTTTLPPVPTKESPVDGPGKSKKRMALNKALGLSQTSSKVGTSASLAASGPNEASQTLAVSGSTAMGASTGGELAAGVVGGAFRQHQLQQQQLAAQQQQQQQPSEEQQLDPAAQLQRSVAMLAIAARHGPIAHIRNILAKAPNAINKCGPDGFAALHYATKAPMEFVEFLLDCKADPNVREHTHRMTPVMLACLYGNLDLCKLLISRGASPTAAADEGVTALLLASWVGASEVVRYFTDELHIGEEPTDAGWTPFLAASFQGFDQALAHSLRQAANPNVLLHRRLSAPRFRGQTPLMVALAYGCHPATIKILLKCPQLDVLERDGTRQTALHLAIRSPSVSDELIEMIFEAMVTKLVREGIASKDSAPLRVQNMKDAFGVTPFMLACECGYWRKAAYLLRYGTRGVDVRDSSGNTALHHAARAGRADISRWLISLGADLNWTNEDGLRVTDLASRWVRTVLDPAFKMDYGLLAAMKSGSVRDVRKLIVKHKEIQEARPDKVPTPTELSTCLMEALLQNNWGIVQYLVSEVGVPFHVPDLWGLTPLIMARCVAILTASCGVSSTTASGSPSGSPSTFGSSFAIPTGPVQVPALGGLATNQDSMGTAAPSSGFTAVPGWTARQLLSLAEEVVPDSIPLAKLGRNQRGTSFNNTDPSAMNEYASEIEYGFEEDRTPDLAHLVAQSALLAVGGNPDKEASGPNAQPASLEERFRVRLLKAIPDGTPNLESASAPILSFYRRMTDGIDSCAVVPTDPIGPLGDAPSPLTKPAFPEFQRRWADLCKSKHNTELERSLQMLPAHTGVTSASINAIITDARYFVFSAISKGSRAPMDFLRVWHIWSSPSALPLTAACNQAVREYERYLLAGIPSKETETHLLTKLEPWAPLLTDFRAAMSSMASMAAERRKRAQAASALAGSPAGFAGVLEVDHEVKSEQVASPDALTNDGFRILYRSAPIVVPTCQYEVGTVVSWLGVASVTADYVQALGNLATRDDDESLVKDHPRQPAFGTLFVLNSRSAVDCRPVTSHPTLREHIIMPSTKFLVRKIGRLQVPMTSRPELVFLNPWRNWPWEISKTDALTYQNSSAGIVIYLQEVFENEPQCDIHRVTAPLFEGHSTTAGGAAATGAASRGK